MKILIVLLVLLILTNVFLFFSVKALLRVIKLQDLEIEICRDAHMQKLLNK